LVGQAEYEARKLRQDLCDLVNGTGVYAVLHAVDRAGLLLSMGFSPESVAPFMSDESLISAIAAADDGDSIVDACSAELVRRLDANDADDSPTPIERAVIERPADYASIDVQEFCGPTAAE
jgi:hypothetical protein